MLAEKALGPGRGAGVRVVLTTASGHLMAFLQKACDLHRRTRKRVPTNSQATVHWKCLYCKFVGTQTLPTLLFKIGKSELSLTMNNECSLSYTRRLARPDLFLLFSGSCILIQRRRYKALVILSVLKCCQLR